VSGVEEEGRGRLELANGDSFNYRCSLWASGG
jgi:hypothetical protein